MLTLMRISLLFTLLLSLGCAARRVIYLQNEGTGLLYGPMKTREQHFGRRIHYTIVPAEFVSADRIRQKRWLAQEPEVRFEFDGTRADAFRVVQAMLTDGDGVEIMRVDTQQVSAANPVDRSRMCLEGGDVAQVIYVLMESFLLECHFGDGVVCISDMHLGVEEGEPQPLPQVQK